MGNYAIINVTRKSSGPCLQAFGATGRGRRIQRINAHLSKIILRSLHLSSFKAMLKKSNDHSTKLFFPC
jgi:hypothetical protein